MVSGLGGFLREGTTLTAARAIIGGLCVEKSLPLQQWIEALDLQSIETSRLYHRDPTPKIAQLIKNVVDELGEEEGLQALAKRANLINMPLFGPAIFCTDNYGAALRQFIRISPLLCSDLLIQRRESPQQLTVELSLKTSFDHAPLFLKTVAVCIIAISRQLVMRPLEVVSCSVKHPPTTAIKGYLDPLSLGNCVSFSFDREVENWVLPSGNADLAKSIEKQVGSALYEVYKQPMIERVEHAILQCLDGRSLSLERVCTVLQSDSKSVSKALHDEGSGYGAIKQRVLFENSLQRVVETTEPISHIALDLGFSNTANFSRAFKRWHGVYPTDKRRNSNQ